MVMIGVGNDEEEDDRRRDGFKGHHRRILTATTEGEDQRIRGTDGSRTDGDDDERVDEREGTEEEYVVCAATAEENESKHRRA